MTLPQWLSPRNLESRKDLHLAILCFLLAVSLYMPGMWWGLPPGDGPGKTVSWASDELGPMGPLVHLHNVIWREQRGFLQYPLFHNLFLDLFYAPYLLFQWLTGALASPKAQYPFGFRDPVAGVQALSLIARGVSVLMGAGSVVVAYFTARTLWDRAAGIVTAVFVLLMYPMFYYARVSNVDVPAFFWVCLVLLLFARTLMEGLLPARRAAWMGLFAAFAVGTKDQNYAVLLLLPLPLMAWHFRAMAVRGETSLWNKCKAPLVGAAVCIPVYLLVSGIVLLPAMFRWHLDFLRSGGRFFFEYPATSAGYVGLCRETLRHLVDTLSWPVLLAGCIGIALSVRADVRKLALLLPFLSFFVGVLAQIRTLELRYLMAWSFILAAFAAWAITSSLRSPRRVLRLLAALVLVSGCTWMFLRGADLTYLLLHGGSRIEAARWLEQHVREGDRVEFFGNKERTVLLPPLKNESQWLFSSVGHEPREGALEGKFVVTMGRSDQESHTSCPAWVYRGLRSGTLGYDLAATFLTHTLFAHPEFAVNPRIEIFVRRSHAKQLSLAGAQDPATKKTTGVR